MRRSTPAASAFGQTETENLLIEARAQPDAQAAQPLQAGLPS